MSHWFSCKRKTRGKWLCGVNALCLYFSFSLFFFFFFFFGKKQNKQPTVALTQQIGTFSFPGKHTDLFDCGSCVSGLVICLSIWLSWHNVL